MIVMINDIPCLITDRSDLKHYLNQHVDVDVDALLDEAGMVDFDNTELTNLSKELDQAGAQLLEATDLLGDIRSIALNGMESENYEDALYEILTQTDEL